VPVMTGSTLHPTYTGRFVLRARILAARVP
jgi:hypothetical protein